MQNCSYSTRTSAVIVKSFEYFYSRDNEINFLFDLDAKLLAVSNETPKLWLNGGQIEASTLIGRNLYDEYFLEFNIYPDEVKFIINKVSANKHFYFVGINFKRISPFDILIFEYNLINSSIIHGRGYVPKLPLNWYRIGTLKKSAIFQNRRENVYSEPIDENGLTLREQEILFLMFHFHSYPEIAYVISMFTNKNVTSNAIGKLIRKNIYEKLGVYNQPALKQKAFSLNYHQHIPRTLLSELILVL